MRQAIAAPRRGLPLCERRRLPRRCRFRGSMARPAHSLSTLRNAGYPSTTQDSLPAAGQALPDGAGYPQGSNERFPLVASPFPKLSWRTYSSTLPVPRRDPKLLEKLLDDAIRAHQHKNPAMAKSFRDLIESTLRKYHNRLIDAASVIQAIVQVHRDLQAAGQRAAELG